VVVVSLHGDRARKVITRAPQRLVGRFPSAKNACTIHWESQLERDLVYLLEFDPTVVGYREQPFTIELGLLGRRRRYTPDFLVERTQARSVIEVKPAAQAQRPEFQELFAAAAAALTEQGLSYQVMTEREIRPQPRLDNIRWLVRYRGITAGNQARWLLSAMLANEPHRLGTLKSALIAHSIDPCEILALLAAGELTADLDVMLSAFSLIKIGERNANHRSRV
jgi:hypothetical protein